MYEKMSPRQTGRWVVWLHREHGARIGSEVKMNHDVRTACSPLNPELKDSR